MRTFGGSRLSFFMERAEHNGAMAGQYIREKLNVEESLWGFLEGE